MIPVRFLKVQPILAFMLTLGFGLGSALSAEPQLESKPSIYPSLLQKTTPVAPKAAISAPVTDAAPAEVSKVVINIPSRTLWVYEGDKIVRHFPVGVGRVGFPTPVGQFSIIRKVLDPGWENPYLGKGKMRLAPGETNPLGTRWMGFLQNSGGEYGMHGTDNPGSVGKFSSHGCVRLKVPDAEALFELVDVGTLVEVVYQPVVIRRHANQVRVVVYADRFKRGMPSANQVKADILKQYPSVRLDEEKLRAALTQPVEKYVSVGVIPAEPMATDANRSTLTQETQPPEKSNPALPPLDDLSNGSHL